MFLDKIENNTLISTILKRLKKNMQRIKKKTFISFFINQSLLLDKKIDFDARFYYCGWFEGEIENNKRVRYQII